MIAELYEDNNKILALYKDAFNIAEQENEQGIADFIASRIDAHGKHNWMLRSILKKSRA
jgi:starvation-inducible DNA-binding protein